MTLGYNTRTISAPIGTVGMYGPTMPMMKFVPLSMFFLNMQDGEEDDSNGFYGKKKVDDEKKIKAKRSKGKFSKFDDEGDDNGDSKSVEKRALRRPKKPSVGGPEPLKHESVLEGKIGRPQKCKYCDEPATKAYIWADGRAYIPVCDVHQKTAKRRIEKTNRDEVTAVRAIPQRQSTASEQAPITIPVLTPIKTGATRASSGSMGTGNVARYHVSLGPPLRRVTPVGGDEKRKRRRSKLKGEERDRWIERLSNIIK